MEYATPQRGKIKDVSGKNYRALSERKLLRFPPSTSRHSDGHISGHFFGVFERRLSYRPNQRRPSICCSSALLTLPSWQIFEKNPTKIKNYASRSSRQPPFQLAYARESPQCQY
ncbi:PREDICTED: uncharacterized protein LOC104593697 [Nelumbo nucifera]|uniref:Uncharacterized protein LOC104593697 n=1 Tax=Nelumbo nucifera TaxID=4432 RepID=A0A1U7ZK06_NELNU|nr:PREDICTED: uncharacterized protein LOC104593697 [Nelumbo nucifera]